MYGVKEGTLNYRGLFVKIRRLSSSNGDPAGSGITGLEAADVDASYLRVGGTPQAITLTDLTAIDDPYTSGGWFEVGTSAPGVYRLDPPNAALAAGSNHVIVSCVANPSYEEKFESENAIELYESTSGEIKEQVDIIKTNTDTLLTDVGDLPETVVAQEEFTSLAADSAAAKTAAENLQTRVPAALVGGRMDGHVGSMADAVISAAKFAAGALDAVWSTTTRILTAGTNIALAKGTGVTGFTDLSQADVRSAVGMESANMDTQLGVIGTDAEAAKTAAEGAKAKTDKLAFSDGGGEQPLKSDVRLIMGSNLTVDAPHDLT